jgi:predicted nucleic acid-binding protein
VTATLVDSNVLIDVLTGRSAWTAWSEAALSESMERGAAMVNQVIYAEVSVGFLGPEECEWSMQARGIELTPLPWSASFLAGRALVEYRRRGGARRSPLPDFFIGAHAAVSRLRILTRDPSRYRSYFPTVELIAPE